MKIDKIVLYALMIIVPLSESGGTSTIVGDMLLIQSEQNLSFLAPTSQYHIQTLNSQQLKSKLLKSYCQTLPASVLFIMLKGFGNLQLSCILEGNVERVFVIKESLQEYRWAKKNIYFHGLEQKTSLLWTKLEKQDGIFKENQIYSQYGILSLQPTINLQSFLFNTMKPPMARGIFQIENIEHLQEIFFTPNSQVSEKHFEFLLLFDEEVDSTRFSQLKNSIFGPDSKMKQLVHAQRQIIWKTYQQTVANENLQPGTYLVTNKK